MRIWQCWIFPHTVPPEPELIPGSAGDRLSVERILSREDWIVALCIGVLVALAWWWLIRQSAMTMPEHATGDPMTAMGGGPSTWSLPYLTSAFLMWALMMVAMMLPSAAPMILLYARFSRKTPGAGRNSLVFMATYLALWAGFSLVAALLQSALVSVSLVSGLSLQLSNPRLSGVMLIAAAFYQLSPLKAACLDQCRSPLSFVMRLWRPGWKGAVRLGIRHGLYCIGCCWALMLLLFVGGVMNLAWIALLTCIVLAEKVLPKVAAIPWLIAGLMFAGAFFMLFAGRSVP